MTTYKLTIAYDGRRYGGWACQPGVLTVQGVLEEAVGRILGGIHVDLTVAGRTDAGVHATGQVASFATDREVPDRFAQRINAVLPRDVAVLSAEPAPHGFDARRWARSRRYRYRVLASPIRCPFEEGRALWWPYPLDREALDACAAAILGEHDFTAFTPTQTEHTRFERRVLRSEWMDEHPAPTPDAPGPGAQQANRILAYRIEADAFMRSMIRALVGTMLEVAAGRRTIDDFRALLEGAPREKAGETAAAHGLCFEAVTYGDGPLQIGHSAGSEPG